MRAPTDASLSRSVILKKYDKDYEPETWVHIYKNVFMIYMLWKKQWKSLEAYIKLEVTEIFWHISEQKDR